MAQSVTQQADERTVKIGRGQHGPKALPALDELSMELTARDQAEIDHNLFVMRTLDARNKFLLRRMAESRALTVNIVAYNRRGKRAA